MKNFFVKLLQNILGKLAKRVIGKFNPEIIGITGSVGKSSTKEAVYTVLKAKYGSDVKKSEGNLNNELGLPLAILGFEETPNAYSWAGVIVVAIWRAMFWTRYPKCLVLEYAADKPGDISYLTSIAKPKVAIITYVGEAHLEFFDSIDKIALEKSALLKAMPQNSWAVLNSDNDYVWRIGLASRTKVIYYGVGEKAAVRARNIKVSKKGTSFELSYQKNNMQVDLKAIGAHQVYSALAAIAVGIIYEISLGKIIEAIGNFLPLSGRDNLIEGINGSLILDSSYNANLTSTKAALETLRQLTSKGKKIAVLGDMREMGKISKRAHEEIGALAKQIADKVVAVGPISKNMKADKWFADSIEAADFLIDKIGQNDIILVKGSHAMEMDKIVKAISNKP